MKILAIDTSVGKTLGLAIFENLDIVFKEKIDFIEDLSWEIVPAIKRLLQKTNISLSSIDGYTVNLGPGSFTGLRIGITFIKALSFATKKPLVGICSLDILANSVEQCGYQICPIIDAKRENVYSCLYEKRNGKLKKISPYLLMDVASLLKKINKKTIFVGDALKLYQNKIIPQKKNICFFAEEKFWFPEVEILGQMAYQRFKKKIFDDLKSIVPIYLYPKECQIRKN